jgi:hypothetical protein
MTTCATLWTLKSSLNDITLKVHASVWQQRALETHCVGTLYIFEHSWRAKFTAGKPSMYMRAAVSKE